jgi:hypothetical protein
MRRYGCIKNERIRSGRRGPGTVSSTCMGVDKIHEYTTSGTIGRTAKALIWYFVTATQAHYF